MRDYRLQVLLPMLVAVAGVSAEDYGPPPPPKPIAAAVRQVLEPMAPTGLSISGVTLKKDRATVSGSSAANEQVSQFLRNIEASPVLETPVLNLMYHDQGKLYFELRVDVRCPAADERLPPGANPCLAEAAKKREVYKCTVDGVSVFQSTPCPEDASKPKSDPAPAH